jgi:hypothetical protein
MAESHQFLAPKQHPNDRAVTSQARKALQSTCQLRIVPPLILLQTR